MTRLNATQRAAVASVLDDEWNQLRGWLRRRGLTGADVDDAAQQVALIYAQKVETVHTHHRAFLYRVAHFEMLKHWERAGRRLGVAFDSSVHGVSRLGSSPSSAMGRQLRIIAALQALPALQQTVVENRHVLGFTLEEVADSVGKDLSTVKRHLAAAEAALSVTLGADAARFGIAIREDDGDDE